jgi:probable rRNA maturation factor
VTTPRRPRAPTVTIVIQSKQWRAMPAVRALVRRAVAAALAGARDSPVSAEVTVALTDDAAIRALNRDWRGRDSATNVLSFPAPPLPTGAEPAHLGDVVLAYETLAREAVAEAKPFDHHLTHLVVHGVLHLLGHDHETDADAARMEGRECAILATLGISDPYGEPAASDSAPGSHA